MRQPKESLSSEELQKLRLELAKIEMSEAEFKAYLAKPDVIAQATQPGTMEIPKGYKRCGKCGDVKKLYLFNKNSGAKDGCTGTCKECQKISARKSYAKTKGRRNYKKYYAEHKEEKIQKAKEYYAQNKERLDAQHKQYVNSKKGKKVMQKARAKRNANLKANAGIPYTRELVIDRDKRGGEYPICYLCGKPITDVKDIHLDHVMGVVIGGQDSFDNIACTHSTCNLKKSKECEEVSMDMLHEIEKLSVEYMDAHPDKFKLD